MERYIFLFILSILCSACDTTVESELPRTSNLPAGTFKAQVEGDITRSISGDAVFETLRGLTGEPIYSLRLRDIEGADWKRRYRIIGFGSAREESPDRGVYELPIYKQSSSGKSGEFSVRYQDSEVSEFDSPVFKPLGGTLEIYTSDESHVEGSFRFEAYDLVAMGSGLSERFEITVSGKFHAVKGDVGIILN